jgi:hypothetical protein
MTTGSSLSIHAASGAIALSGVVGLLMAVVIVRDRPPIPAQRDQAQ